MGTPSNSLLRSKVDRAITIGDNTMSQEPIRTLDQAMVPA
jgi:hypothetical protein